MSYSTPDVRGLALSRKARCCGSNRLISDVKIVLPGSGKLTWPNDVQTMVFTNPGVVQPPDEGVCAVDQDPAIPER